MTDTFRIGAWTVRPSLNLIERDGNTARIPPRMMDVLVYLNTRRGEVVSIDELLENVWHGVVVGEGSVYLSISRLRDKLGELDGGGSYIETIPKRGYRLVAVADADLPAKQTLQESKAIDDQLRRGGQRTRFGWRLPLASAAAIAAAAILTLAMQTHAPNELGDRDLEFVRFMNQLFVGMDDSQDIDQALEKLDDAIGEYPDMAELYAARAMALSNKIVKTAYSAEPIGDSDRLAIEIRLRQDAEHALDTDPTLAPAHVALGNLALYSWHWTDALEHYRRADEAAKAGRRQPPMPEAVNLLAYLGRLEEAIDLAKHRVDIERGGQALMFLGIAYAYALRHDEAVDNMRAFFGHLPPEQVARANLAALATAEIGRGNATAVTAELAILDNPYLSKLAGQNVETEATAKLRLLISRAENGETVGAAEWATTYLALGNEDEALSWLERAADRASRHEIDPSFYGLMMLKMNVAQNPVLEKPAFVRVLNRITGT